ncbi:hypothetical protein [Nocardia vermiculata]|uniref:Uncharacterized protein n=1 Tax=Nocardia vermiculata TaxID=257274 RepID=A0A846Y4C5_9NOCA|nr:hypothetical protein [Nocardia vermiculata]NKY53687.1 hypothetical protein [Nocardia vermiculata]
MNNREVTDSGPTAHHGQAPRPAALGLVRPSLSGRRAASYALEIQSHAQYLGYRWLYTLRPPTTTSDPVGYALALAAGLDAAAVITVSDAHIDYRPERIAAALNLITITPPRIWPVGATEPVALQPVPLHDCTFEPTQLDHDCAHQLWRTHRDCFPSCLARLAAGAALSAGEVD